MPQDIVSQENDDPFMSRSFLILASVKNVKDAYKAAEKAAKSTGLPFKNKKIAADSSIGATFPKDTCDAAGYNHPCYWARGTYDNGDYISIEYSDSFYGFASGYFMVIASSGDLADVKKAKEKIRTLYPKAYIKTTKVYVGCMH
jgi:hypothetical protein